MALNIRYANPGLPVEYELDSDPIVFTGWGGTNAETGSILYRTDLPSIYRKTGPNSTDWTLQAGTGAGGVGVQDEGVPIAGNPHQTLNFVGTGVVASDAGGGVATINIPGGVSGVGVQNSGVSLPGLFTILNFLNGVFPTDAGGGVANIGMNLQIDSPARALETPFQPNLTKPVMCIYSVEIAVGIGNDNPSGNGSIDLCSDPFNPPTTTRCRTTNDMTGQITPVGDFLVLRPINLLVFLVPPTWWVSMETESTGGGPSFALREVCEITFL